MADSVQAPPMERQTYRQTVRRFVGLEYYNTPE